MNFFYEFGKFGQIREFLKWQVTNSQSLNRLTLLLLLSSSLLLLAVVCLITAPPWLPPDS